MILIALILFLAATIQGIVGFALAVIAIPLFYWTGLPLSEAIAISAASTLIQALTGMIKLRQAIPWQEVRTSIIIRLLALPIGLLALVQLHDIESAKIKAVLGACLVVLVLIQLVLRVSPRDALHKGWDILAFGCSGFFAGMVGMGGPPLVIWLAAHRWESDKIRGFLFANFAILAPINLLLIWRAFGDPTLDAIWTGLLFAPMVIAGSLLGVHLGNYISRERFRRVLYAVLLIMGIASMLSAFH